VGRTASGPVTFYAHPRICLNLNHWLRITDCWRHEGAAGGVIIQFVRIVENKLRASPPGKISVLLVGGHLPLNPNKMLGNRSIWRNPNDLVIVKLSSNKGHKKTRRRRRTAMGALRNSGRSRDSVRRPSAQRLTSSRKSSHQGPKGRQGKSGRPQGKRGDRKGVTPGAYRETKEIFGGIGLSDQCRSRLRGRAPKKGPSSALPLADAQGRGPKRREGERSSTEELCARRPGKFKQTHRRDWWAFGKRIQADCGTQTGGVADGNWGGFVSPAFRTHAVGVSSC